jgi:signal transduction histidine kinase
VSESQEAGARILVVDDEEGMREGCRRALAPEGHEIDTAADLASGEDLARRKHYDLVLLDVMMPDGSGVDLIGPIQEQDPDTICIIITGYATVELAVESVKRGAYDFLSKPFTSDQLIVAVNQGLERRRLSLEARRLKAVETQAKELARAKAELEKLDRAKSQFMLTMAHELRAPVAAMQSYLNLILTGYISGDELQPTLARIQERLQELLDLIADLLDLARLKQMEDWSTREVSPQPVADILQETYELLRGKAQQKKQDLRLEILARPTILAQKDHLQQIWMNLIGNAIKYTPEGGRITVSLQADQQKVTGTVKDSGIGIAEGDLPHLFQEFFRTDEAKASGEIGTGLGLAILKQIVEFYRGEIKVTSKLGQGSRFTFVLPLKPSALESAPTSRAVPAQEISEHA